MRIRLKYTKEGAVKFVGHLDTVRLFQRAIKAARIEVAYSQGFNPHSLVYFAMPLSVGMSSSGEYMDIVIEGEEDPSNIQNALNTVLPENIRIIDSFLMEKKAEALMTIVDVADYEIVFDRNNILEGLKERVAALISQETIMIPKKTKKGIKDVDIKPLIRMWSIEEDEDTIKMLLQTMAGSKENLNPELFLKALVGEELENMNYQIERKELYTNQEEGCISLCEFGRIA